MKKYLVIIGAAILILYAVWPRSEKTQAAHGSVYFHDTFGFEGSDTTLASHTPDTVGTSWTQIINNDGASSLSVNSAASNLQGGTCSLNEGAGYTADGTYSTANYRVDVEMFVGDNTDDYNWIGGRIQNSGTGYWLRFNNDGATLKKVIGGTWSDIGSSYSSGIADLSIISLILSGSTLKVFDDGALIISTTDAAISAAGKAGIGMGDLTNNGTDDCSSQQLDKFKVTEYNLTGSVCETRSAGTGVDDATIGSVTWSTPTNITSSDDSYATATTTSVSEVQTHYLIASQFGYGISADSILGIKMVIERNCNVAASTQYCQDNQIRLVKAGTVQSAQDAARIDVNWETSDTNITNGDEGDLWNNTWTDTDINDTNFGGTISSIMKKFTTNPTSSVDHIQMTVCYMPFTGTAAAPIVETNDYFFMF